MARCDLNQTPGGGRVPGGAGGPWDRPLYGHMYGTLHTHFPQIFFTKFWASIVYVVSIGLGTTPLGCKSYLTTVNFDLSSSSGHKAINLSLADLTDRLLAFR